MRLWSKWALLRSCAAAGLVRHTTKARRVVFFAHREAIGSGSIEISPEHLLLGILHVDESLVERFHLSESIREAIAAMPSKSVTLQTEMSSMEVSLSTEARLAMANAAKERHLLGHKHTGTEHLLLGIMSGWSHAAEVLDRSGISIDSLRNSLRGQLMVVAATARGVAPLCLFR